MVISPQIYPCITGGVEIFNYYLVKELAERGHKVWVLTTCKYRWDNENISFVKLNKKLLLHPTLSIDIHIFFELINLRKQIDVVHIPYTSNSPLAYPMLLIKKLFDIPYIITIHGGGMYPWKPEVLHKLFFQYADAIVAVSETIKEEYEKRCGRKTKLILPLIPFRRSKIPKDELRNKYGFKNDDTVILSLGSIKRIKGSDILLDAFLMLGKKYVGENNLKLLYIGDGVMKNKLEKKAKNTGFDRYTKFLGNVSYPIVPEMYKLADIYVIPSLFEGTPKSLLEAMFNGLPVIGTDTNGIADKIVDGKNGYLFDLKNIKSLSKKLQRLVEDKKLREELGKNAEKYIFEHYQFETTVKAFINLYGNVIKKP